MYLSRNAYSCVSKVYILQKIPIKGVCLAKYLYHSQAWLQERQKKDAIHNSQPWSYKSCGPQPVPQVRSDHLSSMSKLNEPN